jgi:carbon-monoxide dehydrogenase medium subunit
MAASMLAYTAPTTVEEAVRVLAGASGVVKVLSGGTDLLVQLRSGRAKPDLIVDIKKIPNMSGIRERDGAFVIGAATPSAVICECEALRQAWPGVVEAANLIGSTQIQGRATLAGNLCNASPAADSVPALIAARATCVVAGANAQREVPVESIVTGPGRTSLSRDEFIVAFHLPKRPPRSADAYLRFIPRTEMDIAVVGAGVSVALDPSGLCTDARVVLGAVAPTALLVADAAAALIGRPLDASALDGLDQAAQRACKPIDDKRGTIEYRIKVAGVMARRAATIAYERAGERQ